MKKHTIEYVNWNGEDGLQNEISKEMGIHPDHFRNYHEVVGGDYKDLWHLWLWWVDHRLYNDSYIPESFSDKLDFEWIVNKWKEDNHYKSRDMERDGESFDWIVDFFKACQRVFDEYGDEYSDLIIYYFW